MSLLTFSINLDTIVSPTLDKICHFDTTQVDNLADLFLRAGDTVRPIILRKISPVKFEILEGYFEYYAAMKAQEIDDQFTAIQAHVVSPDLESTILEQYNFLRSHSASTPIPNPPQVTNVSPDLDKIEEAIANRLEQKLTAAIEKTIEERISASLQVIVGQVSKQLDAHLTDFRQSLSIFPVHQVLEVKSQPNQSIPEVVPEKTTKTKTNSKALPKATAKPKTERVKTPTKDKSIDNNDPKISQVLNDFNTLSIADLESKLKQSAKGNTKFARPIHEQRSEQKFQSIKDVITNIPRLAEKTMQKIIDAW